jgi:hypothetical protein
VRNTQHSLNQDTQLLLPTILDTQGQGEFLETSYVYVYSEIFWLYYTDVWFIEVLVILEEWCCEHSSFLVI